MDDPFWDELQAWVGSGKTVPDRFWPWLRALETETNRLLANVAELSDPERTPYLDVDAGQTRCPSCWRLVQVEVLRGGHCRVVQRDGRTHLCPIYASPNAAERAQTSPLPSTRRPAPREPEPREPAPIWERYTE